MAPRRNWRMIGIGRRRTAAHVEPAADHRGRAVAFLAGRRRRCTRRCRDWRDRRRDCRSDRHGWRDCQGAVGDQREGGLGFIQVIGRIGDDDHLVQFAPRRVEGIEERGGEARVRGHGGCGHRHLQQLVFVILRILIDSQIDEDCVIGLPARAGNEDRRAGAADDGRHGDHRQRICVDDQRRSGVDGRDRRNTAAGYQQCEQRCKQ